MNRRLSALIAGCVALAFAAPADAANLFKRGQKAPLIGDITKVTRTEVSIKPKTKEEETVPVNEIVRIKWDDEPATLNLARSDEEGGRLQKAIDNYTRILADLKSTDPNLKADLEYLIHRTNARVALADPSKIDEAVKKLDDFRKAHPDFYRFYESLDFTAQLQLAKGDFDSAKTAFTQMEQAPWNDFKMAAKSGNARVLLKQGQFAPAQALFEEVVAMPGNAPAEVSRRHDALLGKATCLKEQQQQDEAVKVLEEVILNVSPEDTGLQAEAYLRQGDCLVLANKPKEALLAYLHVDVLFPKETGKHAEALYQLSKLWTVDGRPDRSEDAAARLLAEYPKSDWAKKLSGGSAGTTP